MRELLPPPPPPPPPPPCFQNLDRYQLARIIGMRATQLSLGAPARTYADGTIDYLDVAELELKRGALPARVTRTFCDGTMEYVNLSNARIEHII